MRESMAALLGLCGASAVGNVERRSRAGHAEMHVWARHACGCRDACVWWVVRPYSKWLLGSEHEISVNPSTQQDIAWDGPDFPRGEDILPLNGLFFTGGLS